MIARSKLIKESLDCLGWGAAACLPVVGFFLAPAALWRFKIVVVETNDRWNPARRHAYVGAALALFSMLGHAILAAIIFIQIIRHYQDA